MPRVSRGKSSTGIYHIMMRGINRQIIFEDNEDYERYLYTIKEYKEKCKYEIYGFCLMSNHIHLLIKEGNEELGIIFRRIGASYVYWYNWKYKRSGHLFQDRFKSEAIENEAYFLTVLRYIHQNPVKAGIVNDIGKYKWSSYNEYIGEKNICDIKFTLDKFSMDERTAVSLFDKFSILEENSKCLELEEKTRINDKEAIEIIRKTTGISDLKSIQSYEKEKRNMIIKQIRNNGLSIRQIERVTGISFGIIRST